MNNTQTQAPARSKIDMLRDQRALARDLDDPLMQADLDDEPEPEPAPAPKPEPVPEPVAAKPVSKSKPAAPKSAPIKRPGKSLTRPAVLDALKRCQPATKEVLRLQLESEGYPVSDKAGMGRIRNHLYNMRYAGKAKQLAADLWALPSYSDPNKTPAPASKPESEPAPKQEPEPATPEPAPKPELVTPEPPELPPALVQCHIIEANFETADGETVSVYVASGGRVALTPIGSHAVSFGSLDELRAFVARVHRLRSFLDDPQ